MKILKLTLLLLAVFGMSACDNNYNGGKFHEQNQGHNYNIPPEVDSSNPNTNRNANNNRDLNVNTEIRDIWQNYRVVIDKLGDLKGKVIADIGAGPYGYFTLRIANNSEVKKIIAIDIDSEAIQFIENAKIILEQNVQSRIETRLVEANDPKLKKEEADIILIVNTYVYFENPVDYLKNLKVGLSKNGRIVIIDFKKRNTPVGPPMAYRAAIGKVEQDLMEAGYVNINSDDQTLNYQYIITASHGVED